MRRSLMLGWMVIIPITADRIDAASAPAMTDPDLSRFPRAALETFVQGAPVMMAVLEAGGVITWANQEHERVLGRPVDAMTGLPFADLCASDEDRERARRLFAECSGAWEPLSLRRADDGFVQTSWCGTRLSDGTVAAVGRDVTEERELAGRLARAERLEAIGRLAGGIAHDFNNLLTVISGNAQLLVELRDLTGPAYDEALEIVHAADTARSVVRQLLTFAGGKPQPPQNQDVNERIQNLRDIIDRLIDRPVQVEFEPGAGLPPVRLEEGQLEQIVLNLLMNARDAMPGEGRIVLRTDVEVIGEDGVRTTSGRLAPGRYVSLAVSDTGHGMAPETQRRILEPFFTTKASAGGTGLGLSTVSSIVQQAGGQLDVRSAPGQGSTFTIFLPAAPPTDRAPIEAERMPPPLPPARVLVVDDHPAIRALCRRALENDGHTVLDAAALDTALDALRSTDGIDLVLVDVRLRGEDGRDLLRSLPPGVRVLLMSTRQHAGDTGSAALQKPFTAAALVAAVRRALGASVSRP
ncbi:MAG TPA: ATP-binding protein [Vicinamibacterales bacterium]|nr:ATP-binding protein [Vicinamibacterales bacterium]